MRGGLSELPLLSNANEVVDFKLPDGFAGAGASKSLNSRGEQDPV